MNMKRFLIALLIASAAAAVEGMAGTPDLSLTDEKPYTLTLTLAANAGYESNAIQLGHGLPLPPGTPRKDYGFFTIDAAVDFDWKSADKSEELELNYEYTQQFYEELPGSDEGDHVFDAAYTHVFNDTWSFVGEGTDKYVTIDGHAFSNKVSLKTEVDYQATTYLATQLAGSVATTDNFFPVGLPARNPDANLYSAELFEVITLKTYKSFRLRAGYGYWRNDGEGSDYQYDRNRLQLLLKCKLSDSESSSWYDLNVTAKYVHDFDRYDNPNSHAGPAGFLFKRRDDKDVLDVILSYDLIKEKNHIKNFAINLEYTLVRSNSNIAFFDYDDHIITLGGSITFR
jgi:hypothetical protein